MTIHEALFLIKGVHDCVQANASNVGPWCWPTRELVALNLRLNRGLFTGKDGFRKQLSIAKRKGWVVEEGCQPHCHAQHVRLTATGLDKLRVMNEQGCCASCATAPRPCVTRGLRLKRKAA